MARPKNPVPKLTRHKAKALGVVRLGGRDHYLGHWPGGRNNPPPDVQAAYDRLISEWLANNRMPLAASPAGSSAGPTVSEVILSFWRHAQLHYRHEDSTPTSELADFKLTLRPLRELYGATAAAEFGPKRLAAVREQMIRSGLSRRVINQRIDRLKRVFKWATAEELVPPTVYQSLRTLTGLRAGRSAARETPPVLPVPEEHFAATLPHLPRLPRAIVELQRWTGMRPGEVCRLKLSEIDRSANVWVYLPGQHKTRHRGKSRAVPIGPKAQAVLLNFFAGRLPAPANAASFNLSDPTARVVAADLWDGHSRPADAALLRDPTRPVVMFGGSIVDPDAFVFSPVRDRAERFAEMRAKRKTKVQPSQADRVKGKPKKRPGERYTTRALDKAVAVACEKAGVPHWHPNQLRHLRGTEVRRTHGLEAAQVLLGHSRADVTQVYAERDTSLALRVAGETG